MKLKFSYKYKKKFFIPFFLKQEAEGRLQQFQYWSTWYPVCTFINNFIWEKRTW